MYLRNFERIAGSGAPNTNATVEIYLASLIGVYGSPVSFTDHNNVTGPATVTNSNGMWEAKDLPDGQYYDVKVTQVNGRVKWYFGRTMHQVERLIDDRDPVENRNIVPNGDQAGWSRWVRNGSVPITGITTAPVEIADSWYGTCTGGDSLSGTRVAATGVNALYAASLTYNRVAGQMSYSYIDTTGRQARVVRSRVVSISFSVFQTTNARVRAFIADSAGITSGTVETTTGAWVTVHATRTIDAGTTSFQVGLSTDSVNPGSYSIQVTNFMVDYGSEPPIHVTPAIGYGMSEGEIDRFVGTHAINDAVTVLAGDLGYVSEVVDSYARRIRDIIGGASWRTALPATLTSLLAGVNAAQATANSGVANAAAAQATANTGVANAATAQAAANAAQGTANTANSAAGTAQATANAAAASAADKLSKSSNDTTAGALTVNGNNGGYSLLAANFIRAAGYNNNSGVSIQDRSTHSGTQTSSTISDLQAGVVAAGFARIAGGTYSGNGTNGRSIATGFTPKVVLIQRSDLTSFIIFNGNTILLPASVAGGAGAVSSGVSGIISGGFAVYTSDGANTGPHNYTYMAVG